MYFSCACISYIDIVHANLKSLRRIALKVEENVSNNVVEISCFYENEEYICKKRQPPVLINALTRPEGCRNAQDNKSLIEEEIDQSRHTIR